jgi:hypothetical protein
MLGILLHFHTIEILKHGLPIYYFFSTSWWSIYLPCSTFTNYCHSPVFFILWTLSIYYLVGSTQMVRLKCLASKCQFLNPWFDGSNHASCKLLFFQCIFRSSASNTFKKYWITSKKSQFWGDQHPHWIIVDYMVSFSVLWVVGTLIIMWLDGALCDNTQMILLLFSLRLVSWYTCVNQCTV